DSSRRMLEVCARRAALAGVDVDLRLGDLREPPVRERVPLVICPFRSLLHMHTHEDRSRVLAAVRNLLRPRGRLVFELLPSGADAGPVARARAWDSRARALGRGAAHADADGAWARGRDDDGARVARARRVARAPRGRGLRGGSVLRLVRPHAARERRRQRLDRTTNLTHNRHVADTKGQTLRVSTWPLRPRGKG